MAGELDRELPPDGALPPPRFSTAPPEPDPLARVQAPDFVQTAAAAFRLHNPISSVLDAISSTPGNEPAPGYDPFDTLRGTPHEGDDFSIYAGSHNEGYTRYLMSKADQETEDRRTIASAGWAGAAMSIVMGLFDPTLAFPVVGLERAVGVVGKGALLAGYGAGSVGLSEAALQQTQVTRSWEESAGNIASATILGGVLGTAIAHLSPSEIANATKAIDNARPRVNAETGDFVPQPVGAAATDTRRLELQSAIGLEKLRLSPELTIYNAASVEAKRALKDTAETGLHFKNEGESQVAPLGEPLESQKRVLVGDAMMQTHRIVEDAWKAHYFGDKQPGAIKTSFAKTGLGAPTRDDKLGFGDFDRAVGRVMHFGDVSDIPEVQAAAQQLRSKAVDPISKFAQETTDRGGKPMLGAELDAPKGAQSFFPLMPIRNAIVANRPGAEDAFTRFLELEQADKAAAKARLEGLHARYGSMGEDSADRAPLRAKIEEEIAAWRGNTTKEAKAAMKARDEAAAKGSEAGTKPAADAVDLAVKRILASDRALSRHDLQGRAQQWVDRWIGSPDGRLDYDEPSGGARFAGKDDARGSLRDRRMPIDVNELIKLGFIETSATQGVTSLARTVVPDALLTRRFGDVGMTDVMRRIDEEYSAKAKTLPTDPERLKLGKEKEKVIEALAAVRDRLRGVYGWDTSWQSRRYGAMVRDMQNINILRALGSSGINSMTDLSNAAFRYGFLHVFRDAWVPFFQGLVDPALRSIIREQARDAGVGIDGLLGQMQHNLFDVTQAYAPGNKFSRALDWSADKSMIVNLNGPLTDVGKQLAFNVAQGEMGRATARVVAGKATKRDLAMLDGMSIDRAMAARIAGQYEKHAIEVSGRRFANQANWNDRGARTAFESAMTREANIAVLTPGIGDKPLLLDSNYGKILFQFQSFLAAAHSRIFLSSLQKRDMRVVSGAITSVALGLVSTALYKSVSGQAISSDPRDWLKESLDRSSMLAWFGTANNHLSGLTKGTVDFHRLYGAHMPLTRHRDRTLAGELGGPTIDLAEKLARAAEHSIGRTPSGESEFQGSDVHSLRTGLPLQNLWAFRRSLDAVERGVDEHFGLKAPPSIMRQ